MSRERKLKRLLVTGAAGFIGSHFVKHIRRTRPNVEIVVLDKLTYAGNPANLAELEGTPGYRFVGGDIADRAVVDRLARQVDAIVNFAAETHVDRSLLDPFAFIVTDVLGTGVLADAAREYGTRPFFWFRPTRSMETSRMDAPGRSMRSVRGVHTARARPAASCSPRPTT